MEYLVFSLRRTRSRNEGGGVWLTKYVHDPNSILICPNRLILYDYHPLNPILVRSIYKAEPAMTSEVGL